MRRTGRLLLGTALAMIFLFTFISMTAFAASNEGDKDVKLISSKKVILDDKEKKEYDFEILSDKGNTVYGFKGGVDEKDVVKAHEYLVNAMQTAKIQHTSKAMGSDGQWVYANDTGYDANNTSASAYTWSNTYKGWQGLQWIDKTYGGSSAYWSGSNFKEMKLHQRVSVYTIGITNISWPISLGGGSSGNQRTWDSELVASNPAGASHEEVTVMGIGGISCTTSILYEDSADIYINGGMTTWKPSTWLQFTGF